MIRRVLLISAVSALPAAAMAQSATAPTPAPSYNGGSLIGPGDQATGVVHTVSRTAGDVAGPALQTLATDAVQGQVGNTLLGSGSGTAPVDAATTKLGTLVNKVAAKLNSAGVAIQANGLAGTPVVGNTIGQVGNTVDNTVNPLVSITVVDRQISGSPTGAQLLNASVLSSHIATNAPVVASVLSGGQIASVEGINVPGGVTGGSGGPLSGVVGTVTGLTGGLTGGTGSSAGGPLSGVVGTVTGLTGGLTGGSGAGGLVSGVVGTVAGLTGGLTGGSGSGAGGLVNGVVGTVTGLTGGLTGGTGSGAGGLVSGVAGTVTGLTSGLTGGTGSGGLLSPVTSALGH